ncbi:Cell division protein DedD [Vibrio stylophorae]|uniref:Cell division protein DedD n=1 Tax=Vibrio stylophorae TaxID=659351 RepID=A0ABM8ZV36_9VIBR|nr:SPOR domain-containing protein [Vibrio stylophorae]CAH0534060.1 Cell division protein DedD [Vibrio stylophorae]
MASQFQSRLVGTIILVALGVIILPDLFDGEKAQHSEQFEPIPLSPDVNHENLVVQAPEAMDSIETVAPTQTQTVSMTVDASNGAEQGNEPMEPDSADEAVSEPVSVTLEAPANPKADFSQSAWVIQLGVFSNHDNAQRLVKKLQGQGFDAQVITKGVSDSSLNRVVVGPALDKGALEKQVVKLETLTGLKGQVLRFDPLAP